MNQGTLVYDMVAGLVGGLFVFLLGMKYMSDGMQAVAGSRLRRMISAVTDNRFMACATGALVTAVIQSSSVTTVMLVGMVNAGVMTLLQAVGVILGADIGTTVTAWIVALKIIKYGLPTMGVAGFCYLFARSDRVRDMAMAIMGVGMVFFGLALMKHGLEPVRELPWFVGLFSRFDPSTFAGVLKCIFTGALVTAVVQSSSATIAITITLAATGVVSFQTAVALVLGENIGTTITAFLASLGTSRSAKCVAYAHIAMKVAGVGLLLPVFFAYMRLLEIIVPDSIDVAKRIAVSHTLFNVLLVCVFLPLRTVVAGLVDRLTPKPRTPVAPRLTVLDVRLLGTPTLAIQQSAEEVAKMSAAVGRMFECLRSVLQEVDSGKGGEIDTVFQLEETLDHAQKEIVEFITHLLAGNVSHDLMDEARKQLRVADEFESISDYLVSILKHNLKLRKAHLSFSVEEREELLALHDKVAEVVAVLHTALRVSDGDILVKTRAMGGMVNRATKAARQEYLARMEVTAMPPLRSVMFVDMLQCYRKIKDHGINIAEALVGEK